MLTRLFIPAFPLSLQSYYTLFSVLLLQYQGNEMNLNKASLARLMPFVFNPTIAQALPKHCGRRLDPAGCAVLILKPNFFPF